MFDLKTIVVSAVVAIVTTITMGLVGGNQPAVGGDTRFPNSTLSAAALDITNGATFGSPSATTSIDIGRTCFTVTTNVGSTTYWSFRGVGTSATFASSTTSCL